MTDFSGIKELYPYESHYFGGKNRRLHYVDEGSGTPMVMVHGNPSWSFMYRGLIDEFRKTYRVIAVDHLGCGMSDKPQDFRYRLETHIDNLENLLLSLDLEDIVLCVHDWGGPIAMGFAIRHPQRIKSIVIFNTAAFSMNWMPWRIALLRIPWISELLIRKTGFFIKSAIGCTTHTKMPGKVREGYLLPYDSYENRIALYQFIQDIPMGPEHRSFELLLEIEHGLWMFRESPVCIIWGMRDWCFKPKFLERWKVYYPQARVHQLDNAAHYLLEDALDDTIDHLKLFFKDFKI